MSTIEERAAAEFVRHLGGEPSAIALAPGRVNLIGDHTDYNDGFVLPTAIDRATAIALRPRTDRRVRLWLANFGRWLDFSLGETADPPAGPGLYICGVARELEEAGYLIGGLEGVVLGEVPIAAGLSSSASLEMAAIRAFEAAILDRECPDGKRDLRWEPMALAQLAQRVEHRWVGVQCGIMDQLIVATGEAGHASLIDCRSLAIESVPLPPLATVVVLDTGTRRGLVDSVYNERRAQCEAAARALGASSLRDVSREELEAGRGSLDEVAYRRARHVIGENARTLAAADAMKRGDLAALGQLFDESHDSLRNDFEVSSSALDQIVDCARRAPGCHGARMTGAGLGGCAVALVESSAVENFVESSRARYEAASGQAPAIAVCRAAGGARIHLPA